MSFWDTSALVSLLLFQQDAESLAAIVEANDDAPAVWWGTGLEAVSALVRLARAGEINDARASRAVQQLDNAVGRAYEVPPTEALRAEAHRAIRVHGLTAGDALQLAAALVWAEREPSGKGFVCLDRKLCEAARREGFDILPQ
jgi:predicted nucleic acid-binding protein